MLAELSWVSKAEKKKSQSKVQLEGSHHRSHLEHIEDQGKSFAAQRFRLAAAVIVSAMGVSFSALIIRDYYLST